MTTYRSSLVYENEGKLEFCWGVQPQWLHDGALISVKRAPTKFGMLDFTLKRTGSELKFDYRMKSTAHQANAEEIRLHIPKVAEEVTSVRVNGQSRAVAPGRSVITLARR